MNILVIGADRGLGKILSKMLKDRGHQVAAGFYNIANDDWTGVQGILPLQMNVLESQELKSAVECISEKLGRLDAVVDVAGILLGSDREKSLMEESLEDVLHHIKVNAVGLLAAFRAVYPILNKGAKFLAVTSEAGSFACAGSGFPAYGISKTAANKVVQTLRYTVEDVDLVAVHPGRMNTEMGRTTAQIEPEESAEGFCRLLEQEEVLGSHEVWFIDYQGKEMPLQKCL